MLNEQSMKNIPLFIADLQKMSQAVYLACDAEVACDISLKVNKAIRLINALVEDNKELRK